MRFGGMVAAGALALLLAACGQPSSFQDVAERAVKDGFPGVALYVRQGSNTWTGAAGVSDAAARTPLKADDRFLLVRDAHPIVAAAVWQLVVEGSVRPDASVTQYIGLEPLYTVPDAQRMTVTQALTHTTGLRDIYTFAQFQEDLFGKRAEAAHKWTPKDLLAYLGRPGNRPTFAPGQGARYSPANAIVLAMIIEGAGGKPLAEALRTRIFTPAGMTRSGVAGMDDAAVVHGYTMLPKVQEDAGVTSAAPKVGTRYDVSKLDPSWAWPAIATTAGDLGRFAEALFGGRVVTGVGLQEMRAFKSEAKLDSGTEVRFGAGLLQRAIDGVGTADGFEGAGFGFTSFVYRLREQDLIVVGLANASGPDLSLDKVLAEVARLVKSGDKALFATPK